MTIRREQMIGWIQRGVDLYAGRWRMLCAAGLLAGWLSVASFGVLTGAMLGGLAALALGLHDHANPPPRFAYLFEGLRIFVPSLLFTAAWLIVELLLGLLMSVLGFFAVLLLPAVLGLSAFALFTLMAMMDRKMPLADAIPFTLGLFQAEGLPLAAFAMLALLIGMAGMPIFMIGAFATFPLGICILAAAYRDLAGPRAAD